MYDLKNTQVALAFGYALFCMNEGVSSPPWLFPELYDGTRAANAKDFVAVDSDGCVKLTADLGYCRVGFNNRFMVPGDWQIVGQISDIVSNGVGKGHPVSVNLYKVIKGPSGYDPLSDNDPDAEKFKRGKTLGVLAELEAAINRKSLTPKRFVSLYFDVVRNVAPRAYETQKASPGVLSFDGYQVDARPFFADSNDCQTVDAFGEFVFYYCEEESKGATN